MKPIQTSSAPSAIGPYSQAIDSGSGIVFVSGQLPIDPATGAFPDVGTVPEDRNTDVTNSKNSLFRIAFIDENILYTYSGASPFTQKMIGIGPKSFNLVEFI